MSGATTLQSTGPIKFSEIRKMYAGGTGATNNKFSHYYKGVQTETSGTVSYPVVPNAPSTSTVSASGAISFSQFRGTAKEYNPDAISTDTNKYNLKSKFDSKFATTATTNKITIHGYDTYGYVTRLTVNSGKTIYSDTPSTPALTVGAFPAVASVYIDNAGNVYGAGGNGGAAGTAGAINSGNGGNGGTGANGSNGGTGGTAVVVTGAIAPVQITNSGNIKGGGGGGGGGTGGGGGGGGGGGAKGSTGGFATNYAPLTREYNHPNSYVQFVRSDDYGPDYLEFYWDGQFVGDTYNTSPMSITAGGVTYTRGTNRVNNRYSITHSSAGYTSLGYASGGAGGAGGAGGIGGRGGDGGKGQGYTAAVGGGTGGTGGGSNGGGAGSGGATINGNRTSSYGGTGGTGGNGNGGGAGGSGGAGGALGSSAVGGNLGSNGTGGNSAGGAGGGGGIRGTTVGAAGASGSSIIKTTNTTVTNTGTGSILPGV